MKQGRRKVIKRKKNESIHELSEVNVKTRFGKRPHEHYHWHRYRVQLQIREQRSITKDVLSF